MALPQQLKSARMTNDTVGLDIDNEVGNLEKALCAIFGFTEDVDITESPFLCDNSGRITKDKLRQVFAGSVGHRFRDSSTSKEFQIVLSAGTHIKIDENTGTEGVPVWTNRAKMALDTGVWTFTGIPEGPASDPTTDNQLTRKFWIDSVCEKLANKGIANGYAGLDAGVKVPTAQLGGAGADATKFLRGDQTWQVPASAAVVQRVHVQSGAVATGSTQVVFDDSIPQITEGVQFLTPLAITPTSADNYLYFEVNLFLSHATQTQVVVAVFRDSEANAIAAMADFVDADNYNPVTLRFRVLAGSTGELSFSVRAGGVTAGTMTLNGVAGARKLGGVLISSFTIEEVKA